MVIIAAQEPGDEFDFDFEARMAAVGEVCQDDEAAKACHVWELCLDCAALKKVIERKLKKAFVAGRIAAGDTSITEMEDIDGD